MWRTASRYPAVLFLTGDNDGRVNPYNSRKMAARLQAANRDPYPSAVYLRTTSAAGHGIGSSLDERIAEQADVYAFLFDQIENGMGQISRHGRARLCRAVTISQEIESRLDRVSPYRPGMEFRLD